MDGEHEEHAVDPVEEAAVAGQERRGVLDPRLALEERLDEIADLRDERDDDAEEDDPPRREAELRVRDEQEPDEGERHHDREGDAADGAGDRLAGAHGGDELRATDEAPDEVGTRVAAPCEPERKDEHEAAREIADRVRVIPELVAEGEHPARVDRHEEGDGGGGERPRVVVRDALRDREREAAEGGDREPGELRARDAEATRMRHERQGGGERDADPLVRHDAAGTREAERLPGRHAGHAGDEGREGGVAEPRGDDDDRGRDERDDDPLGEFAHAPGDETLPNRRSRRW
ncbi:MAG: hypothetical protein MUF40_07450 [Gemmatimonadaceae bacterium]|nr:hypothetical protein [Gemmatimonadaceae bacterium]